MREEHTLVELSAGADEAGAFLNERSEFKEA